MKIPQSYLLIRGETVGFFYRFLDFVCGLVATADSFHNAGGALTGAIACVADGNGDAFHIQKVLSGAYSHDHQITGDGNLFFALGGLDAAGLNGADLGADILLNVVRCEVCQNGGQDGGGFAVGDLSFISMMETVQPWSSRYSAVSVPTRPPPMTAQWPFTSTLPARTSQEDTTLAPDRLREWAKKKDLYLCGDTGPGLPKTMWDRSLHIHLWGETGVLNGNGQKDHSSIACRTSGIARTLLRSISL